ncbi:protein LURP-one-related 15 [Andrographis paniculata]|uniref:protein LURP-one-related 15 n=1 Tax=Andrographis paniculata TaxID=175694 RepID=UPI0021E947E2|nr:protein LURP-one-related 15 [Andrographis paniculata]
MAGNSSYASAAAPVAVISPNFCVGYAVDLHIVRKLMTLSEGSFTISDSNGGVMFTTKGKLMTLHDRRLLLDAAGNPIITYQQKLWSPRRRWQAFRGQSNDERDMIFSVRKSSILQMRTKLEVFMASNTREEICDFRIEGSWFERSCVIYAGNSDIILAKMHRKHSASSVLLGKDHFMVTVHPNVDYAFIVALVVILEEINTDREGGGN